MKVSEILLPISRFVRTGKKSIAPKFLTIHFTNKAGQGVQGCYEYFVWLSKQGATGSRYGSSHYIIGLKGEILRCVPEHEVAYHNGSDKLDPASSKIYTDMKRKLCGGVEPNNCSIGIEVCHEAESGEFTAPSMLALIELSRDIVQRYDLQEHQLVRHFDIVGWKQCPKYYVENEDAWLRFKASVFGAPL